MKRACRVTLCLLLLWCLPAFGQGQSINGDRTVQGGLNAGIATGAVNTYALTLAPALGAYVDRQCFLFKANVANTGVATLNVNGLGAKTLKKRVAGLSTDLAANDIGVGQYVTACYDGTVMQVQSLGGGGGGGVGTLTALTGDISASGTGSVAATLVNIPNAVPMAGALLATAIAAPATPAAGKGSVYFDTAAKNLAVKDDAGIVKHGVQSIACGSQFISAINDAGLPTCTTAAGTGNVSATGGPTAGLTAEWTTGTVIQGVGVSGTGLYLKQTSPNLVAPVLGVASATSLNKLTLTPPATGATLTLAEGKVLTASNTMTLTATDGSTVAFGAGGTVATLTATNAWTGRQNAGGAASTAPNKVGTAPPGTCTVGDTFFDSDSTAGANMYGCTATNVWTVQGAGAVVGTGNTDEVVRYSAVGTAVGGSTALALSTTAVKRIKNDITHITANTPLDLHNIVTCTSGSGTIVATLPAASSATAGRYTVMKDDLGAGECQVAVAGSDTINGLPGPVRLLAQWSSVVLEVTAPTSPGNWYAIAVKAQLGIVHLPVAAAKLPPSNAALIDQSESRPKLLFDAATSWCASWTFHLPPDYSAGPFILFDYSMFSAAAGSIKLGWSVWKTTSAESVDAEVESYAAVNTCTDTAVPAAIGRMEQVTCPLTNADAMVANDLITLKACRDISGTAGGNLELLSAQLQYIKQ